MVEFCYFFPFNAVGVPKVPSEVSSTRAEMQGVWKLAANRLSAAKILAFDVDIFQTDHFATGISSNWTITMCLWQRG